LQFPFYLPVEGANSAAWSLVACVVAPGFDFDDFDLR
jgi:predicted cupin superfamily sugar epimerase